MGLIMPFLTSENGTWLQKTEKKNNNSGFFLGIRGHLESGSNPHHTP